jgi:hypothetical protein
MHCTMLTLALIQPFYVLDQDHVGLKSEVQAEQAQVKAITNIALDQGKPQCI